MGISRFGARALAGPLVASLLVSMVGVQVARAAGAPGFATLTGTLPAFSSTSPVTVKVLAQGSLAHLAVGQTVPFTTVMAPVTVQGTAFSVTVPDSTAIEGLATQGGGNVNLMTVVQSGTQMSAVFTHATSASPAVPAPTATPAATASPVTTATPTATSTATAAPTATATSTATAAPTASPTADAGAQAPIRLSNFPAPWTIGSASGGAIAAAAAPAVPATCEPPVVVATHNNNRTRIGELHVAAESWMEGVYSYNTSADSTVTVGTSANGTNWAGGGTIKIDNSIGSGGTLPHTGGWVGYVNDTMDFEEYAYCGVLFVQAVSSHGDTYDGTNSPAANPYGTCHNAIASNSAWRIATVPHGDGVSKGTWNSDTSTVQTFGLMTSIWGWNFTGATGYAVSDRINWSNGSTSTDTYVCGAGGNIAAAPVLYNNPN